jgi:hypothetical protein
MECLKTKVSVIGNTVESYVLTLALSQFDLEIDYYHDETL